MAVKSVKYPFERVYGFRCNWAVDGGRCMGVDVRVVVVGTRWQGEGNAGKGHETLEIGMEEDGT